MSDKPFAVKDGTNVRVLCDAGYFVPFYTEKCVDSACKRINAAVDARERAAAAKALRDGADYIEATTEDDPLTAAHVAWLRARAAAIEGGA